MELEEKLAYFKEQVQEAANENVKEQVDQYQAVLQKDNDQTLAEARKNLEERLISEKNDLRKEHNKKLAQAQIKQQRELYIREEELKQQLFKQYNHAIQEYMQTDAYFNQLIKMMQSIMDYADNCDGVELYIDNADAHLLDRLKQQTGYDIRISDRPFVGGVRGVLRERNILVDYSFQSLLKLESEEFAIKGESQPR